MGRGRAPSHEDADAEGLAPRLGERLHLALADGDRELGALGHEDVGRVRARGAGDLQQLGGEVAVVHRGRVRPSARFGATKRS